MVYCSISQSHSTSDYKLYNKIYDNTPILDWTLGTDVLHSIFMISENKLAYSLTKVIRVCCGHSIRCKNFIIKHVLTVPNKVFHMEYLLSSSAFVVNFPSMKFLEYW